MTPQKIQLVKNKRDATLDLISLAVFVGMTYFAMNPDKYDELTDRVTAKVNAVKHRFSVWQAKLVIRSLPETDES